MLHVTVPVVFRKTTSLLGDGGQGYRRNVPKRMDGEGWVERRGSEVLLPRGREGGLTGRQHTSSSRGWRLRRAGEITAVSLVVFLPFPVPRDYDDRCIIDKDTIFAYYHQLP